MVGLTFFGDFDLASLAIRGFRLFFALLVGYLQTGNMREGYPLETEDSKAAPNQGPLPLPKPKTDKLPHGRGEVTVPNPAREARELALRRTAADEGFPDAPTGDPMVDGGGPSSWTPRRDLTEPGRARAQQDPADGHGAWLCRLGRPRSTRSMPVETNDLQTVGTVTDMWGDASEQRVRYLEITRAGGAKKLIPMPIANIVPHRVRNRALSSDLFAGIPATKAPPEVTLLEEDQNAGCVAGGLLHAADKRASRWRALFG